MKGNIVEIEESEDLHLIGIHLAGYGEIQTAGVSASGDVFLRGDIHPLGSFKALQLAQVMHIPYVAVNAVEVLYPADWLRAECLADAERVSRIDNAVNFLRSGR